MLRLGDVSQVPRRIEYRSIVLFLVRHGDSDGVRWLRQTFVGQPVWVVWDRRVTERRHARRRITAERRHYDRRDGASFISLKGEAAGRTRRAVAAVGLPLRPAGGGAVRIPSWRAPQASVALSRLETRPAACPARRPGDLATHPSSSRRRRGTQIPRWSGLRPRCVGTSVHRGRVTPRPRRAASCRCPHAPGCGSGRRTSASLSPRAGDRTASGSSSPPRGSPPPCP